MNKIIKLMELMALMLTMSAYVMAQQDVITITANGVSFKMVRVQGGTFKMGATSEQGSDAANAEKPTHNVTLSNYYIGETEVTQALWEAVMGSNPSSFKGAKRPVEEVSWDDCQEFIHKLNSLTGRNFRLPTEAEWEFAARGGNKSEGYEYSGSNVLGDVAWWSGNSGKNTHDVGTKPSNELGLYDMSGNVCEWCQDWYGDYTSTAQTNPKGPSSGYFRVVRGGSWYDFTMRCRISRRYKDFPGGRGEYYLGLRLAESPNAQSGNNFLPSNSSSTSGSSGNNQTMAQKQNVITITANGVSFKMVRVQGGTFTMGATSEQGSDAANAEKPTHNVTLSNYYIGETEVTQALWEAVMGSNPSRFKGSKKPVERVSWYDCQEFIRKLNSLTGQNFRLPTEAEWEFAARGGVKSHGYKYSGSNTIEPVAWCIENTTKDRNAPDYGAHNVKTKSPNELGLYDMSGNVCEWCQDWYGVYTSAAQTNPKGPSSGSSRVNRGGSFSNSRANERCRVSSRSSLNPDQHVINIGFRLAQSPKTESGSNIVASNSSSTSGNSGNNQTMAQK